MRGPQMSPAAPCLMGLANSGMPQTHPGPSPTPSRPRLPDPPPLAFPGSQGAGDRKSHTKALSDPHKFAQAYVNHAKTDKFSY